jgi:hypothetical protein
MLAVLAFFPLEIWPRVLLQDEKNQGIGFPIGIEKTVGETLKELTERYLSSWPELEIAR